MKTQAVITINDADIKARVDQIIAGQLKTIVDEKLGNFVEGHLAKHKLQGRAPKAISDRIETMINATINRRVKNLDDHICDRIDSLVGQSVRKHLATAVSEPKIKENVMKFLQEKLSRSLKQ